MFQVSKPWEMLGCDLMTISPTSVNNNKYIFTATDYFTKWVEAFAIPDKTAKEVAKCLVKIFCRHGASHCILTDQGREFVNKVIILQPVMCSLHMRL